MVENWRTAQIRLLDHTADMGFEAKAQSAGAIFEVSAMALSSILIDWQAIEACTQTEVQLEAPDIEGLMYAWLSEILYLFDAEKKLFSQFQITKLDLQEDKCELQAILSGELYDRDRHEIKTYVKAITFHQLEVITSAPNCSVRVFVDI